MTAGVCAEAGAARTPMVKTARATRMYMNRDMVDTHSAGCRWGDRPQCTCGAVALGDRKLLIRQDGTLMRALSRAQHRLGGLQDRHQIRFIRHATTSCRLAKWTSGAISGRRRPAASAMVFFAITATAGCSGHGG